MLGLSLVRALHYTHNLADWAREAELAKSSKLEAKKLSDSYPLDNIQLKLDWKTLIDSALAHYLLASLGNFQIP